MKKLLKKVNTILLAALVAAVSCFFCFAAGISQKLYVTFSYEDVLIEGADIRIYRIGDIRGSYIEPEGEFVNYKVNYDVSDSSRLSSLSLTLSAYAQRDKIVPLASDVTDESGKVDFGDVRFSGGAYLIVTDGAEQGDRFYMAKPVIALLPYGEEGVFEENVTAVLKSESVLKDGESIKRSVLKVWNDGEGEGRPVAVAVELLKNGQVYDTVILNEENSWKTEWTGLSAAAVWSVVEKDVPDGYTVSWELEGITFVITNSAEPTEPTEPTKPQEPTRPGGENETTKPDDSQQTTRPGGEKPTEPEGELPYTGTPTWQIPYFAVAGLILLIVGYVRLRKGELADE